MQKIFLLMLTLLLTYPSMAFASLTERPITIIVPSKEGGATDILAELFVKYAKKYWPECQFSIKTVPGSGGQKGFEEIAQSDHSGYTMGLVFTPQLVSHIVSKRARYSFKDFHFIGGGVQDPVLIVVPSTSPIQNLKDFVAHAKKKQLRVSVNSIGSDDFIAAKIFEDKASVYFNLLSSKGSVEQKDLVVSGQVAAAFMNISQVHAAQETGGIRMLAVLQPNRLPSLKHVPTAKEEGYAIEMMSTRGFALPSKVDAKIQAQFDTLLTKIHDDPDFILECEKRAFIPLLHDSKDYTHYLQQLLSQTQKLHKEYPW